MVLPKAIAGVIAGSWLLLNNTPYVAFSSHLIPHLIIPSTDLNGDPLPGDPVLGRAPVGLLIYDAKGYMSANLASTDPEDRPMDLTYPSRPEQPDSEWAIVGRETLAYSGNLSATEDSTAEKGQLIHGPLSVANVPSWTGTSQLRNYTVYDGPKGKATVLHIYTRNETSGVIGNLYWEKLP